MLKYTVHGLQDMDDAHTVFDVCKPFSLGDPCEQLFSFRK